MQALSKENVHRKAGEDRFEKLLEKWAESGMGQTMGFALQ